MNQWELAATALPDWVWSASFTTLQIIITPPTTSLTRGWALLGIIARILLSPSFSSFFSSFFSWKHKFAQFLTLRVRTGPVEADWKTTVANWIERAYVISCLNAYAVAQLLHRFSDKWKYVLYKCLLAAAFSRCTVEIHGWEMFPFIIIVHMITTYVCIFRQWDVWREVHCPEQWGAPIWMLSLQDPMQYLPCILFIRDHWRRYVPPSWHACMHA